MKLLLHIRSQDLQEAMRTRPIERGAPNHAMANASRQLLKRLDASALGQTFGLQLHNEFTCLVLTPSDCANRLRVKTVSASVRNSHAKARNGLSLPARNAVTN